LACRDPLVTEIYVGSTCRVPDRRCQHRNTCNNASQQNHNLNVYQYIRANGGWNNFELLVIEQIDYTHKHELLLRERHHLEQLKATLNKQVPGRTREEILAYHKEYRDANKVEESARRRVKHDCLCGGRYTLGGMSHHAKTQKHINFEAELPVPAVED
jgi:hypothetical protein